MRNIIHYSRQSKRLPTKILDIQNIATYQNNANSKLHQVPILAIFSSSLLYS